MADELGTLNIKFTADTTNLNQGIEDAMSSIKTFRNNLSRSTKSIDAVGGSAKGVKNVSDGMKTASKSASGLNKNVSALVKINIAAWAIRGARALTNMIGTAFKMGSDLTEIENLFQVSFGNMADEANAYAQKLSDYWGVSISATKEQIAYLNNMYKQMGMTESTAYGMSTSLEEMSWNLASLVNKDQVDVLNAMKSATLGISRPMKNLGVVTNVATLQQTAFEHGITSTNRELTQQEKALAAVWAIYDQTKSAMESGIDPSTNKVIGDMSKTLLTNANMMRIVKSQATELGRTWGVAFQPIGQVVLPLVLSLEHALVNLGKIFAAFIGRIFGYSGTTEQIFNDMVGDFATTSTGVSGLEDLEDATEAVGDTADSSKKKIDKLTGGIDELNILSEDSSDSTFGTGDYSGGGIETDIGVPSFDTLGDTKVWDLIGDKVDAIKAKVLDFTKAILGISVVVGTLYLVYKIFKNWDTIITSIKLGWFLLTSVFSAFSTGGLVGGFEALGTAIGLVINPITLLIAAIALVIAVFVGLMATNQEFHDKVIGWVSDLWKQFQELGDIVIGCVGDIWNTIKQAFTDLMNGGFGDFVQQFAELIYNVISGIISVIEFLVPIISAIIEQIIIVITPIINFIGSVFATVTEIINNIIENVRTLYNEHKDVFDGIANAITTIINIVSDVLGPIFETVFGSIGTIVEGAGVIIDASVDTIFGIFDLLCSAVEFVGDTFSVVWNFIGDLVKGIINFVIGFINDLIGGMESLINIFVAAINVIVDAWNNSIGGALDAVGIHVKLDAVEEVSFGRIPTLADGGLAYGDTLAQIGEYSGARSNPEVISPLSDLTTILSKTNNNEEEISLLKQQNELLTRLISKDTTIKVDGRTLATTNNKYNRKLGTEIVYSK